MEKSNGEYHAVISEESDERSRAFRPFIENSLDSGVPVLLQRYHDGNNISHLFSKSILGLNPDYRILFDQRIKEAVTTPQGIPVPDKKPHNISKSDWRQISDIFTSHSELKEKTGSPHDVVFIGGVLENCVANAIEYHHRNYRISDQDVFYVPELCVSFDGELLGKVKPRLHEMNVDPIKLNEAIDMAERKVVA